MGTGAEIAERLETYPLGHAPQCAKTWLTTFASLSGRAEGVTPCRATVVGPLAAPWRRHTTARSGLVSPTQHACSRCFKPRPGCENVGLPTQRSAPVWARSPLASAKTQRICAQFARNKIICAARVSRKWEVMELRACSKRADSSLGAWLVYVCACAVAVMAGVGVVVVVDTKG